MLDYTSAILPVTVCDKSIDVIDVGYVPLNKEDEKVQRACEYNLVV